VTFHFSGLVLTFQFGNSTFNRLVLSHNGTKLHNVFVFCRELKLEDKTDHLRQDLNAMNIRVDELNKVIEHLNIDRSKCVDEIQKHTKEMEQLSPAMEASVSTYSRNSLARTWMARTPWSVRTVSPVNFAVISCHINPYFSIINFSNSRTILWSRNNK